MIDNVNNGLQIRLFGEEQRISNIEISKELGIKDYSVIKRVVK